MLSKGTAAPGRFGRVSGGPGGTAAPEGTTAPGVERPGGSPGGQRRGIQRPLRGAPGEQTGVGAETRLTWAGRVVAVALAIGMLVSPALWLTRSGGSGASLPESFPLVPPLPGMEVLALPTPLDAALLGAVLALCALAVVLPGRRAVYAALLASLVLLVLPDLMRWQPWTFFYALILATLVLPAPPGRSSTSGAALRVKILRIIVASVYLYSGANKVNASFFSEGLAGFLGGMPRVIGSGPVAAGLTYLAPGIEIAAGAGLILGGLAGMRRVQNVVLGLAVSTNLFVLTALMSASANVVVWPWNLAMILLVVALYARQDEKVGLVPQSRTSGATWANVAAVRGYSCALFIVALASVMPLFGVAGYWPSYLSWALYSENTQAAMIDPPGSEEPTQVAVLAYERLGVPAYPSLSVYEALGEQACDGREVIPVAAPGDSGAAVLAIRSRPDIISGEREVREYRCPE